jgi:hypothetical protein
VRVHTIAVCASVARYSVHARAAAAAAAAAATHKRRAMRNRAIYVPTHDCGLGGSRELRLSWEAGKLVPVCWLWYGLSAG